MSDSPELANEEQDIPLELCKIAASMPETEKELLVSAYKKLCNLQGRAYLTVESFDNYFRSKYKKENVLKRFPPGTSIQSFRALFDVFKVIPIVGKNILLLAATKTLIPAYCKETKRSSRKRRNFPYQLPPEKLKISDVIRLRVTECSLVKDCLRFNFHLKDRESDVRQIMGQLKKRKQLAFPRIKGSNYVGYICAAPDPASQDYCRVKILDHQEGDDDCLVQFLDFGFETYVDIKSLRRLPYNLLRMSPYAMRAVVINAPCCDHLIEQMATDMLNSDEILVRITGFDRADQCYEVYVYTSVDAIDAKNLTVAS